MTWLLLLQIHVASKTFTENVILAEMATQLLQDAGISADHRRALGGTEILWHTLLARGIDVYPEYTGTLRSENLKVPDDAALRRELAARGINMSRPLGFNDTYAIG